MADRSKDVVLEACLWGGYAKNDEKLSVRKKLKKLKSRQIIRKKSKKVKKDRFLLKKVKKRQKKRSFW